MMRKNLLFSISKTNLQFNFSKRIHLCFLLLVTSLLFSRVSVAQCSSNATSTADEDIFNVTLGTLNNNSTCGTTGGAGSIQNEYSNYAFAGFAGGVPNIDRGCTIPFSIQVGTCGGNYNNAVAIYIDWNNDADFVDAGENVYLSAATTNGPHTETGNITVPVGATLGNCKMRVVNVETTPASISPCGTYSWGETEDYFVNVTNGGGVAPYISSSVTQLVTGGVSQCATLQQIICIPVVMGAGCTAGNLTQFQLGAGSSTNLLADVSKIHIYYTGTTNVYTASNEFVTGGTTPTGASNTINGSQALTPNATNYFWVTYDMNNSSTLGDLIDGSCTQITVGGSNQTPSSTNPAGTGTIVTCPCSFSLGSDITLCAPFTYTLNGPAGFDTYTWTPGGASTQNLVVSTAGTYTCTGTLINGGLVNNGDFSSGNTGFVSNYILGPGGAWGPLSNPGTYSVTNNPNSAHTNFYTFGDHTTGTGSMLVCNGSSVANDVAWSQTITVTPNTFYNFSAWVASTENMTSGSEAQLQFSINGSLIGPVVNAPLTGGVWSNFFVNWNSGSNTSAIIKIVDQNISGGANDFALDDINFERICTFSDVITINSGSTSTVSVPANITVCNSGTIAASSFTSSTAGVTYTWSNTNTSIGLAASGTGNTPTFTAVNTGTTPITSIITVTPSVGSCIGTPKSYTITVNPNPTVTVSVTNSVICLGSTTTLNAGGASTYTWSGGVSNGVAFSPTVTNTYTVTGTSAAGCTNTAVQTITVNAIPTVTASITNSVICLGNTTTLNAGGASTYTWTGGVSNGVAFSPTITGTYTVTGTSASGCTNTAVQSVTVNTSPTVTVNSPTTCAGVSTLLTANGATSYSWSTGATTQTISVSPLTQTIYTVTGTTLGCSGSNTSTVSVNAALSITINSPTICSGTSTVLTAGGATNYTWSTGATTTTISISPTITTTYSVTGESSGCTGTSDATVTVNSIPVIAVNNATLCAGTSTVLTASGATSYSWSTGATTSTISVSPTGTTIYTVTGTTNGCTGTNTSTVTINAIPTVTVDNPTTCSGVSTTITASGATSYSWSTGAITSTISVAPTSNTSYTVTGTTNGCTGIAVSTVSINSALTVGINSATICAGTSTILTASGATNYTWSTGATTSSISVSPTSTVVYSVTGESSGCTGSNTATVTIISAPIVVVNNATICAGVSTVLTASGATNYTWSTGAMTPTVSVSPTSITVYSVTGESFGCIGNTTATVSVNALPIIGVSNSTICAGSSATLTANGGTSYTWTPGPLTGTSVTVTPSASTIYTVVGSDGICSASATGTVLVAPCASPCTFTLANDVSFCSPLNYTINGPVGYTSYSWTPGGATTQNLSVTAPGTYTCTAYMYSNDLVINGNFNAGNTGFSTNYSPGSGGPFGLLSNSGEYAITTSPNLVHNNFYSFGDHTTGTGNMLVCNGSNSANDVVWDQTITVSPNTNYNFSAWATSVMNNNPGEQAQLQFSINGTLIGSVFNVPLTGNTWANFFVNWNSGASTSAVIKIVDQNTFGNNDFALDDIFFQQICSHSDEITITENITPTVTASVTNSVICSGNSTALTASGASTYTWTGGVTNGTVFSPTITTSYTVTGTSAVGGCTNTAVKTITVNATPTLAVNSATICVGETASLVASPSINGGSFNWLPGNQTSSTISVSPLATSGYSVIYTVNNCSVNATSSVVVNAAPTVSIASVSLCAGQTGSLTAIPSITGGTYVWGSSGQTTQTISDSPSVNSVYGVLYSLNGCTATATGSISVSPNPVLTLSSSTTTINPMDNAIITATGGGSYSWNTGETSSVITVNPQYTTTYCATVTTAAGCKDIACLDIIVMDESSLYIPNVFTPNGDGVNDIFYTPSRNIVSYNLNIFNRWGQQLFSTDNPLKGWDGVFGGKPVPDGVYVYILEAKGADNVIYKKSGHITVLQ